MKTILITGCSSGFGLEIARYFLDRDWKVVATMRTPRDDVLPRSEHLRVLALDVTKPESIRKAIEAVGPIDVLVNNAGIGFLNALEGTPLETAREIFETNTLGTIAMTQAVLPQFRHRKAGIVVNVTSSVTLRPLHLLSVYTASKAAVNAFTESLALELEQFNVRVRIVLPGRAPETKFGDNARSRMQAGFPEPYGDLVKSVFENWETSTKVTLAVDVAEAVWRAVNDPSSPMRIPAGADAVEWAGQLGFHRIRHYGLLASATRKASIARARELLITLPPAELTEPAETDPTPPCPCCGGRMRVIESFGRWCQPRAPPQAPMPPGTTPS